MYRSSWISLFVILFALVADAQKIKPAPKPVYADPIHDGAADRVIIWNKKANRWWMFYTNRRANIQDTTGVQWVHGTKIGIAESKDGSVWKYYDTANINYSP